MIYFIAIIVLLVVLWWWAYNRENLVINDHVTIRFHYTSWCAYCKIIWPVWDKLKKNINFDYIVFEEIDEDIAKTPGIYKFPTILKVTRYGKVVEYNGTIDYDKLYKFILSMDHII